MPLFLLYWPFTSFLKKKKATTTTKYCRKKSVSRLPFCAVSFGEFLFSSFSLVIWIIENKKTSFFFRLAYSLRPCFFLPNKAENNSIFIFNFSSPSSDKFVFFSIPGDFFFVSFSFLFIFDIPKSETMPHDRWGLAAFYCHTHTQKENSDKIRTKIFLKLFLDGFRFLCIVWINVYLFPFCFFFPSVFIIPCFVRAVCGKFEPHCLSHFWCTGFSFSPTYFSFYSQGETNISVNQRKR